MPVHARKETCTIWFHERQQNKNDRIKLVGKICEMALLYINMINLPFSLALFKVSFTTNKIQYKCKI